MTIPSARPIATRIGNKLFGARPIEAVAAERRELAPAQRFYSLPALHLPDELDRVVAFSDDMPAAEFRARTAGGWVDAPATLAYKLRDALLVEFAVYGPRFVLDLSAAARPPLLWRRPERMAAALLATNWVCEEYFGHWLTDGLSLELLARDMGLPSLSPERAPWGQEPGYRDRLGLQTRRARLVRVEELWCPDDRAVNDDRRRRMAELRRRAHPARPTRSGPPVFLQRVGGRARHLANQDAIAALLVARGFRVLVPETTAVSDLQDAIGQAELVVSVEGSALCHAIIGMRDGGTILALQPPERVNWIQKVWCDCADLRFAYTVCDPASAGSFTMPAERLLRAIDLVSSNAPISA